MLSFLSLLLFVHLEALGSLTKALYLFMQLTCFLVVCVEFFPHFHCAHIKLCPAQSDMLTRQYTCTAATYILSTVSTRETPSPVLENTIHHCEHTNKLVVSYTLYLVASEHELLV